MRAKHCAVQSLIAVLLVSGFFSGCGRSDNDAIRFGLSTAPITLDPRFATDATSVRINRLIYRQLVDFDDNYRMIPSLARWERLNALRYRFYLQQEDREFHNGSRLTAYDVKATYDFILDDSNASPLRAILINVAQILVIDDDTVDFLLTRPDNLLPGYLTIGILPSAQIKLNHPFNQHPIGSGPFKFVAWPGAHMLRLKRRADHQRVEFVTLKDVNTRVLKLLRKEVDILQNDLYPELIRFLAQRPDIKLQVSKGSNFTYMGFNLQDPVLKQREVRLAIAHALNRQEFIQYLFGGAARVANSILTSDHWAGDPGLESIEYDPAEARRLLENLGFSVLHPVVVTYKTSNDPFRVRLATVIQSQLARVGIKTLLRTYDWGTFYADIKSGHFQVYTLSWVGIYLPDIFRYVFHSASFPPQGANRGRFSNSDVDQLIDSVEAVDDFTQQINLLRKLQRKLLVELPYVPLWYEDHVAVYHHDLVDYRLRADGNYDGLITITRAKPDSVSDARTNH